jgi:predicted nucleotidyltransferase
MTMMVISIFYSLEIQIVEELPKCTEIQGGSFSENTGFSLTGVSGSSVAFGDYDNDGDLDILLTGDSDSGIIAKVYRNTGGSFNEDTGFSLTGVYGSSVAFGDYDNDGDLDILLTGDSDSGIIAKVYRNAGGSFSEDTGFSLTGVYRSSVAFGDYDNDGDLDIVLTGKSDSNRIARIYNNSSGIFTEATNINLTGVDYSSVAFGDYDNDGDLDLLICGDPLITKLYQNTGDDFVDSGVNLLGVRRSSAAFGDYDNDGDLDILLSGYNGTDAITLLYRNTDGSFLVDPSITLPGVYNSSVAFGDYDNDDDMDILLSGDSGNGRMAKIYQNTGGFFCEDTDNPLPGVYNSNWGQSKIKL